MSEDGKVIKWIVRTSIFDRVKQEFVKNTTPVIAKNEPWKQKGTWSFNAWRSKPISMNPIIFLTTGEDINVKNCDLIFELVLVFNDGNEITCGYATIPV